MDDCPWSGRAGGRAGRTAANGHSVTLITNPFDRGYGSTEYRSSEELIVLEPAPMPSVPAAELPKVTREIPAMSAKGATPIAIDLVMTKANGISGFGLEGGPFWRNTSVRAAVGDKQLWTITNKAIWAHPIHLHGFFFQEVDEKGVPVSPRPGKTRFTCRSTRRSDFSSRSTAGAHGCSIATSSITQKPAL